VGDVVPLREHLAALDAEKELRYQQRYEAQQLATAAAFAAAKEALSIKDEADRKALNLAREIQTYKDEQANRLREQINGERGLYATKDDLKASVEKLEVSVTPMISYIASQQGRSSGLDKGWAILIGAVTLAAAIFGMVAMFRA